MPNEGDDPKFLREALFRFFVNVSFLNQVNENNYCMLVHTSGKRADHSKDHSQIVDIFNILCDQQNKDFVSYVTQIFNFAKEKLNGEEDGANKLTKYILDNIQKHDIVVMNSDVDKKNFDCCNATDPVSLFTIAIGGNIVSRGVTFNNLLSMFFTRDVKNKMQQDTYIQRARMFGSRGDYLNCFELTIPEELYAD
ncbi:MAG: Z1 domain-containing protein [Candidatus Paceibacterota bacterium]